MLVLPNQTPGLIESYGLTRPQVDQEVWAVDAGGQKWGGAAAINRTLQELGGLWAWAARVYALPPVRWIEDWGYRWIARHRAWLSRWYGAEPEWKD